MKQITMIIIAALLVTGCKKSIVPENINYSKTYETMSPQDINQAGLKAHARGNYSGLDGSAALFRLARVKDTNFYAAWFNEACALSRISNASGAAASLQSAMLIHPAWVLANVNDADLSYVRNADTNIRALISLYDGSAGDTSPVGITVMTHPVDPQNTLDVSLVLEKNGALRGTGTMSGATGMYTFKKGHWVIRGKSVAVHLSLEGEFMGRIKTEQANVNFELSAIPQARRNNGGKIHLP
ncbi:MAG: hypothetical protein HZC28_05525 [Spirochaetes bacterium]|nr:hypothetical protein [Spirochaetota bacterium]